MGARRLGFVYQEASFSLFRDRGRLAPRRQLIEDCARLMPPFRQRVAARALDRAKPDIGFPPRPPAEIEDARAADRLAPASQFLPAHAIVDRNSNTIRADLTSPDFIYTGSILIASALTPLAQQKARAPACVRACVVCVRVRVRAQMRQKEKEYFRCLSPPSRIFFAIAAMPRLPPTRSRA